MCQKAKSLLIIEDDLTTVAFLVAALDAQDYDVVLAGDGETALDAMEHREFAVVVLDLNLPRLNGFEVCRQVREFSNVPILVISGRDSSEDKTEAMEIGADYYLTKPFHLEEFLARLKALLRRAS